MPLKKRGRPLLLSNSLDELVQAYLHKTRGSAGVVNARIVVAAAKGMINHYNRSILEEYGGHVHLNLPWAYSLLKRMNFVNRKATTLKSLVQIL